MLCLIMILNRAATRDSARGPRRRALRAASSRVGHSCVFAHGKLPTTSHVARIYEPLGALRAFPGCMFIALCMSSIACDALHVI